MARVGDERSEKASALALPADLRIVRHPRARRLKLRLDRRDGTPVLTLPPGVSERAGLAFVRQNLDWLAERRAARPAAIPFADGVRLPFQSGSLVVVHDGSALGGVERQGERLLVSGDAAHVNRRVTDWLRREATGALRARSRSHAARLGVSFSRVRVADQRSRWGSCSSRGVLSYNWRLILAPLEVLDYVAAHEVAHLREMNHGPAFHRLLAGLHADPEGASRWLNENAARLRRYGG